MRARPQLIGRLCLPHRASQVARRTLYVRVGVWSALFCWPAKTSLKVFDITATMCGAIGSILINDVIHCRNKSCVIAGCIDPLLTSSKLAVSFLK
jgi:hypothetical protein